MGDEGADGERNAESVVIVIGWFVSLCTSGGESVSSWKDEAEEDVVFVGVLFHGAWLAFRTSGEAGFLYGSFSVRGTTATEDKIFIVLRVK